MANQPKLSSGIQEMIRLRLGLVGQRYTPLRVALVATLAGAGRPLTVPEVVEITPKIPLSSAYRNITVLIEAGIIKRVLGTDDHGRFELAEDLSRHHHHLICSLCGKVEDLHSSDSLETALGDLITSAGNDQGYQVVEHRLDLVGVCRDCQSH